MRRLTFSAIAFAVVAACGGSASTTTAAPVQAGDTTATTAPGHAGTSATTIAAGGSAGTAAPSTGGSEGTAPPPDTAPPATGTETVETEVTRFSSGDELLEATVWRTGSTWVVLGHMRPADRASWAPIGDGLAAAGYSVLAYDNRGYGGSTGTREPFALLDDASAAIAFARAEGAEAIVYGGASMNGATAMIVGATEDVAAVFMLSAVGSFPSVEDAEDQLADIPVHAVFFAARDDGSAVADAERFLLATPLGEMYSYDTGGHGTDMFEANPNLIDQVLLFLEQHVG